MEFVGEKDRSIEGFFILGIIREMRWLINVFVQLYLYTSEEQLFIG